MKNNNTNDLTIKKEEIKLFNHRWVFSLFITANVILILGIVISMIIKIKSVDVDANQSVIFWIPFTVCFFISLALMAFIFYYETKEYIPIRPFINKKWFKLYALVFVAFAISCIIDFVLMLVALTIIKNFSVSRTILIVNVTLAMLWSLIIIGFYRYVTFKIAMANYIRRKGLSEKEAIFRKEKRQEMMKNRKQEIKKAERKTKTGPRQASSGLLDEAQSNK